MSQKRSLRWHQTTRSLSLPLVRGLPLFADPISQGAASCPSALPLVQVRAGAFRGGGVSDRYFLPECPRYPAFNEASLLGLMERIASVLEDEAASDVELKGLQAAIGERGLGTPATRAEIIEGLIRRELLERIKAKGAAKLTATPRGRTLVTALEERGAQALTLPLKTAQWEERLQAMERGDGDRRTFLAELEDEVRALCNQVIGDAVDWTALELVCPKSGEPVREAESYFVFPAGRRSGAGRASPSGR